MSPSITIHWADLGMVARIYLEDERYRLFVDSAWIGDFDTEREAREAARAEHRTLTEE